MGGGIFFENSQFDDNLKLLNGKVNGFQIHYYGDRIWNNKWFTYSADINGKYYNIDSKDAYSSLDNYISRVSNDGFVEKKLETFKEPIGGELKVKLDYKIGQKIKVPVMGGFEESEITGITIGINAEDGKIVKNNHNSTISYKNVWGGKEDVTQIYANFEKEEYTNKIENEIAIDVKALYLENYITLHRYMGGAKLGVNNVRGYKLIIDKNGIKTGYIDNDVDFKTFTSINDFKEKISSNDFTDKGEKFVEKKAYADGGDVENLENYINIDKIKGEQYKIVTDFRTLRSLSKNGFIELHENTGLRYKNYEDKMKSQVVGRVTNVRHDYIKSATSPNFEYNNKKYAIGYIKGLNFLELYVLEDLSNNSNSFADGGSLDDINLVAKAIEYVTGSAIDKDSIKFEADEIAFKYKSSNKTWTTISQKLIKDTISMHRKSLELRGRYAEGGEVKVDGLTKQDFIDAYLKRVDSVIENLKEKGQYDSEDFDLLGEVDKEGGFTEIEDVGYWLNWAEIKGDYDALMEIIWMADYTEYSSYQFETLAHFFFGKPMKIDLFINSGGDVEYDYNNELQKIKLLLNKIDFDEINGVIDYDERESNTDIQFYKDGKLVMSLKGDWNEESESLDTIIEIDGETTELNYHPLDSMGGLDLSQLENNINEAFRELNTYSAVVSIEGYEEYAEDVEGLENARATIQDIKGNTRFQVLKGSSVGIGKRVDESRVIEEFRKGGNVSSIEKKVAEVNRLIELGNKNGISVVDSRSTWEAPMKYKPIRYSNGVLYVEYQQLDLYKYNKKGISNWVTKKDKVLKRDMQFDNPLNDIAKMYRKALKQEDVEYAKGGETKNPKKYVVTGNVYDGGEIWKETFDNIDEAYQLAREIERGWTDDGTYYLITIYNEKGKKVETISDDKYLHGLRESGLFEEATEIYGSGTDTKKVRQSVNENYKGYKINLQVRIASYPDNLTIFDKTFDSIFDVMDKIHTYYEEDYYAYINNKDLGYWEEKYYEIDENRNYIKGKYGWSFIKENGFWIAKDDYYDENRIVRIKNGKPVADSSVTKRALKQIIELEAQKKYSEKPKHNKSLSDMKKIWDKLSDNYRERENIAFLIGYRGGSLERIVPYKWNDLDKAIQIQIMNAYFGQTDEAKEKIINQTRKEHEALVKKHKTLRNLYGKKYADGGEAGFDDAGTSMGMYHEKKGNFIVPKGQIYLWLYDNEDGASKMNSGEYDFVMYPYASISMVGQRGFIPPLKRIWTKKFQKDHKGSEHLLGVVKAYLIEEKGKKELFIDMMSVNPNSKKKGIMSYMIKDLRDTFNLSKDQVKFSQLTKEGDKFVNKGKYADGGNTEILTKPRPVTEPAPTQTPAPSKPDKNNPYKPKVTPKPKMSKYDYIWLVK